MTATCTRNKEGGGVSSCLPYTVKGLPPDDLKRTPGRSGYIYLVTNRVNGKQYIGQTAQTILRRWNGHRQGALKSSTAISRAIRKYGIANFEVQYVCRVESHDLAGMLNGLEKYYIKQFDTLYPKGYNIHTGGNSGPLSESTKEKLRLAHLGKKASPETRAKMSASRRGRKISEHQKEALRLANMSRVHRRGFTISDKQKAQISAVHKGKVLSLETRLKISASVRADIERKRNLEKTQCDHPVEG